MSLKQFNKQQYGQVFGSGDTLRMASFKTQKSGPLVNIEGFFHILGPSSLGGSETLTMELFGRQVMAIPSYL